MQLNINQRLNDPAFARKCRIGTPVFHLLSDHERFKSKLGNKIIGVLMGHIVGFDVTDYDGGAEQVLIVKWSNYDEPQKIHPCYIGFFDE